MPNCACCWCEKKRFGSAGIGHEQGQRLPLPAREAAYNVPEPVFQAEIQLLHPIAQIFLELG